MKKVIRIACVIALGFFATAPILAYGLGGSLPPEISSR